MIETLQEIGLTKNEAKVYFAFLQLGESSVLQIAKKTRLHRSVVHGVIDQLIKEGVLLENVTGTKRKIEARSPDYLREILRREQRELRKKELKFEEQLPELRQMYRHETAEYKVTIFSGDKGIEHWCDLALETATTEMIEFVRIEELAERVTPYLENSYFPRKNEIGLPTRFLFADTPYAREYVRKNYVEQKNAAPLCCKFIPDDPHMMHGYMVIWDDRLSFYSSRENKVTMLRDENIANHERAFFDALWEKSGESFTNRPNENWREIVKKFTTKRTILS